MNTILLIGILIPFFGTILGASLALFMKQGVTVKAQKALLGFASGVMVAASVWSLLIPSMEMCTTNGENAVWPAAIGFILGMGFLLLIDTITPHLHQGSNDLPEGPHSKLSRTTMLSLAVTIHNLPEGMAVGVVLANALVGGGSDAVAGALAMAVGIALQNIPEGAIVAMPLRSEGNSRCKSFLISGLSAIVEPIGTILILLMASALTPVLPYLLSFSAGAMMYVVVEELIPESSQGDHSNIGTMGFAFGFVLMMVLDVVLG